MLTRTFAAHWCSALLAGLGFAMLPCHMALAIDRPFLRLETATVDDDGDQGLEASWLTSQSKLSRSHQLDGQINLTPEWALEAQLGWSAERQGPDREKDLDLELRHVLIDHRREGWGLAVRGSLGWRRPDNNGWALEEKKLMAATLMPVWQERVFIHLNAGMAHTPSDAQTRPVWALGTESAARRSWGVFAEVAGHAAHERLLHAGLRWWIKKEKVALQWSRSVRHDLVTGLTEPSLHVGLTLYDLGD